MTRSVTVRAPGKVNLQLSVGPLGDDGYHPLATVFQAIDLYEWVTATPRDDDQVTVSVSAARGATINLDSVPTDDTNLVVRAAHAIQDAYGITDGVDLDIVKGVPVAGGMAGGSADAAAALLACAEAWHVGATRADLDEIGATLGSDVPFALHGKTAVGLGRGTQLSPAMTHGQFHWVLAMQHHGLSTPEVYGEFDREIETGAREARDPRVSQELMAALMAGDPHALGNALENDLESAALSLAPRLRRVIDVADESEALGVMVSGSGPTIAVLAKSRKHALSLAAHLTVADVCDDVVMASGPVAGATVIGP